MSCGRPCSGPCHGPCSGRGSSRDVFHGRHGVYLGHDPCSNHGGHGRGRVHDGHGHVRDPCPNGAHRNAFRDHYDGVHYHVRLYECWKQRSRSDGGGRSGDRSSRLRRYGDHDVAHIRYGGPRVPHGDHPPPYEGREGYGRGGRWRRRKKEQTYRI